MGTAFGEAVLRRDYRALAHAPIATPDATTAGASRKAWLRDESGPYLLKATLREDSADAVGEALTSQLLARLLPASEFVAYKLVEREGELLSSCGQITNEHEELAMAWQVLSAAGGTREGEPWIADILGRALDGFEDEITAALSACPAVPNGYAQLVATLFVAQRNYVNQIAQL